MVSRPVGTVTFLMTDIEGSTQLWEGRPGAMPEALLRHDAVIAEVVHAHGGHFVASREGDATVSVFESAAQAVVPSPQMSGAKSLLRKYGHWPLTDRAASVRPGLDAAK